MSQFSIFQGFRAAWMKSRAVTVMRAHPEKDRANSGVHIEFSSADLRRGLIETIASSNGSVLPSVLPCVMPCVLSCVMLFLLPCVLPCVLLCVLPCVLPCVAVCFALCFAVCFAVFVPV